MTDPYANIRRALEMLDPEASPKRWTQALTELRLACDPSTIRALVEERDALREDAWQPIGTAPKDGTRIMLGNEHGAWVADWRPVYQSGYRPDNPWASSMLNHWHIASEHRHKRATHWRPLPSPPAIDQARGKAGGEVEGG